MRSENKKIILLVVILTVVILAIIGGIISYLALATDTFKSSKDLFQKYLIQEVEQIKTMANSKAKEEYEKIKNTNLYDSNAEIAITYSEGGEVSNPFNDLSIKYKTQKDGTDYIYKDVQVLYDNEKQIEVEAIKDQSIYGLRFTDVIKQFTSIRSGEDISKLGLDKLGLEEDELQTIINLIEENIDFTSEITKLKSKYTNLLSKTLENATYTSQKNSVITLRGKTIKANQYIATLNSSQTKMFLQQILNTVKTDETILNRIDTFIEREEFIEEIDEIVNNIEINKNIPAVEVTIYEQQGKTVKIAISTNTEKLSIENWIENSKNNMKIEYNSLNTEQEKGAILELSKMPTDVQEDYEIKLKIIVGEENYDFGTTIINKFDNESVSTETIFEYEKGITSIGINTVNTITTANLSDKFELTDKNNVIFNDLDNSRIEYIINIIKNEAFKRIENRINILMEKLQSTKIYETIMDKLDIDIFQKNEENEKPNIEEPNEENQLSQIEINRFNAKFEFYTGDEVSSKNVKTLIEEVAENLKSVEINKIPNTENSSNNKEERYFIKLYIQKDNKNEDLANGILEKINDDKKYKVTIYYKDANGLIDNVTIEELEK